MRVLVAVPVVVACVLGLGGCRDGDHAAPPATPVVAPSAADPLAGIEAQVDAVERDVDSDAVPGR